MNAVKNTPTGDITIEKDVLRTIAGSCAVSCAGVVGMASVNIRDGLVKLLKRENLKHGVQVIIKDNRLTVLLHIVVSFGVSIAVVAESLISDVAYKLSEMAGMEVEKICVYVEDVRFID
jgi:uncharacterized alkaline shock family protein YloU